MSLDTQVSKDVEVAVMQVDGIWVALVGLFSDFMGLVPGDTLNDKTELLANILAMAGVALSVSVVVGRLAAQRGKRRPATLADLDSLGASLVASLQERIVDQLTSQQVSRLQNAEWLEPAQRDEAQDQLRRSVLAAVRSIASDGSEAGRTAALALTHGNLASAERYFEGKVPLGNADDNLAYQTTEALHMKAALQSLHDATGAVDSCLRAVRKNPADPLGWSRLGHLYLRVGKLAEAKAAFEKAVKG